MSFKLSYMFIVEGMLVEDYVVRDNVSFIILRRAAHSAHGAILKTPEQFALFQVWECVDRVKNLWVQHPHSYAKEKDAVDCAYPLGSQEHSDRVWRTSKRVVNGKFELLDIWVSGYQWGV